MVYCFNATLHFFEHFVMLKNYMVQFCITFHMPTQVLKKRPSVIHYLKQNVSNITEMVVNKYELQKLRKKKIKNENKIQNWFAICTKTK